MTDVPLSEKLKQCLDMLIWKGTVAVLQIGAGDGRTGDYLHDFLTNHDCRALLLEPVEHIFQQLQNTYRDFDEIHCQQLAVAETAGKRDLYRVGNLQGLEWWADQLASFNHSIVMSHANDIPDLEDRLEVESVECVTAAELIERFSLSGTQLLAIDTEGHDAILVREFLQEGLTPEVILFEHKHLSEECRSRTSEILTNAGYHIMPGNWDTLACSDSMQSALTIF